MNINVLYRSRYPNTLSSLLSDATTIINETCDNSQYKLKKVANINNNVNTCACMLHLVLLQVIVYIKLCKFYFLNATNNNFINNT